MKTFIQSTLIVSFTFITLLSGAQNTYTWTGASSSVYSDESNWTPSRTAPSTSDVLVFNNGQTTEVSDFSTENIGSVKVENSTQLRLSASITHKTLTIANDLVVSEGSSLTIAKHNGVKIDVEMNDNSQAEIGGQLIMEKGVFDFNNSSVILYSNSQPLGALEGKFSLGEGSTLQFGKNESEAADQIILPNDIFVGHESIANLIINSAKGVKLGNQSLTITNSASFISGDLETNNTGYVKFTSHATLPTEHIGSKIVGFAEMLPRTIGYDSISFLGYNIASGNDDLGTVSILRSTGAANFSEDAESIAVTWDVNVDNQPVQGRYVSMQWFEDFDNGINVSNPLQMYRYTNGTEWEIVGGATEIASNENGLRTSATIITNHFSEWTMGDGLNNALPVSLVNFSGKSSDSGVFLNWATASELNNDKFLVEKMVDGVFELIGTVQGNGTTSALSQYTFSDINPSAGANYYRLSQVDFDGKSTSFETIAVEHKINTKFEIYPNPTTGDNLNINIAGELQDNAKIKLYNAKGVLLLDKAFAGNMSMNVLEGQQLTEGLYYLELVNGVASEKRRVIIR